MTLNRIIGEHLQRLNVALRGEILKGSHADMGGCNAGQNRAGKAALFTQHRITRCHSGKGLCGGDIKGLHGTAHQIFAQHRADPRTPVAVARIGGGA